MPQAVYGSELVVFLLYAGLLSITVQYPDSVAALYCRHVPQWIM